MYSPPSGHHVSGRPRFRKAESDPGHVHSYVARPYTHWQRPAQAHQTTEPTGMNVDMPSPHVHPRNSPVERIGSPFVPLVGSHIARYQRSNSPSRTTSPTAVSPRSPSPQRSGHQRSPSWRGSVTAPQGPEPLTRDIPRPALGMPVPHPAADRGQVRGQGVRSPSPPTPTQFQSAAMQRQGLHRSAHRYQEWPSDAYQSSTSPPHLLRHHSSHRHRHHHHYYPQPSTTHHITHRRSRSLGPPSAASHRYASTFTQPVYGHGSSATSNDTSRTSLNGGVPSQRSHRATSPAHGTAVPHYQGTRQTHTPSGSSQRSHSRVPSPSIPGSIDTLQSTHKLKETPPSPPTPPLTAEEVHRTAGRPAFPSSPPTRPLTADELFRSTHRPALPANYDGQMQTRYVNMLLALDGISPFYYILSAFFTWILLAGFVLLPGTFASWKNEPAGSPESFILGVVNHLTLYVVAFLCTGIGACGMIWLWWKWHGNYIWVSNRIFIPGCLNSVAGVISTLSSIYGAQGGVFGRTEKSAIIVTASLSVICGLLVIVYEFWLIRNLKLEHDHEVGVELAGKYGEGVMGEKRDGLEWREVE